MASTVGMNLEELLAPIPGDNPAGESLRWEPVYDEIRTARRQDDKDALVEQEENPADWHRVIELCCDTLARRSKDLQVACWLTEAWVNTQGFGGLRDGLRLLRGLLDGFWETLYPEIDDEDLEPRVAPLVWITESDRGARLPNTLRELPLAPSPTGEETFSYIYWKSRFAPRMSEGEDEDAYARRLADAETRAQRFEDAVAAQPLEYYLALQDEIQGSQEELAEFGREASERFGVLAPGTSAMKQALEECGALIRRIISDKGGMPASELSGGESGEGNGQAADDSGGVPRAASGAAAGPIQSREDAMRRLQEVASYLRRTDPHSPVSYLVQRAVNWSKMPLEQLLTELIQDEGALGRITEMLGMRRSEDSDE